MHRIHERDKERKQRRIRQRRLAAAVLGLTIVLIAALAWLGQGPETQGDAQGDSSDAIGAQVPSGALSGLRIGVDPGHGGYDGGCENGDGSILEKDVCLQIAVKVGAALEELGAKVTYSRLEDIALLKPGEEGTGTKKRKELDNRIALFRDADIDMLLSIHMNAFGDPRQSGAQVFYLKDDTSGGELARFIQTSLAAILDQGDRRKAQSGDYYILRTCQPAVLIECGFLSNPAEAKKLIDPQYQTLIARGVAAGVADYIQGAGQ